MFASRPPIRRIFEIHSAITAGTYPNTATLASRFEVHRRTISRDIEYMRDQLRAPIEYSPARRGFYYGEPNYSLPIIPMTEGEVFALFLAEKVLRQYKGTPYEGLLKSAFAKLVRNLPDEISIDLQEAVHDFSFDLRMTPPFDPEIFNVLVEAVRKKSQVRINYRSPWSRATSERVVDPYHLANVGGRWYLVGFCHMRNELRMFTPSRIRHIELTGDSFLRPKDFDPEKFFESSFGVMTGARLHQVKLKFNAKVAGFIRETTWHPSQRARDLPDGGIILTMQLSDLKEVKRWALSWGENVKVLGPAPLREGIRRTLASLRGLYGPHESGDRAEE
jgi:predicted DNA-binding transcriptional regulator YafY